MCVNMKKRFHRSVGCFGFRRVHLFSNQAINIENVQSENPPIQNSNPKSQTSVKELNPLTSSDHDLLLNTVPKEDDVSPCSTSQSTASTVHLSNVSYTKTGGIEESRKYLVHGCKVSEPHDLSSPDVRKQQSMGFQSHVLNPSYSQDKQESHKSLTLNYPSVSTLMHNSSETCKTVDFDPQYKKQSHISSSHCDRNGDVSENVYKYSLNFPSCKNVLNSMTTKCPDKQSIRKSYHLGIPSQRSNHPLKVSPSFMTSNSMNSRNDSLLHELKDPSSFVFANQQREMVEELQATKTILLKLKRLLTETPISENSLYSSTFKPTNVFDNSLHSFNLAMCHFDTNQSRFQYFPLVTEDNRMLPFAFNKPMSGTGLEELIDSLAQLHFDKSEILCTT
ncbi:unnamed protein product [Schistosoma turkestanicum]|nr:unnamed protein product [Schistosoma turkestanicum]